MSQIGPYTVLAVQGDLIPSQTNVKNITAPGQYGQAYIEVGSGGKQFQIRSIVDLLTLQEVINCKNNFTGLVGYVIDVIDDYNTQWNNYMVMDVEITSRRVTTMVGGINENPAYIVEATWTLETQ